MTLTALAESIDGQLIGSDAKFSRLSTDTRTLKKGEAYLALVGPNFDGNDFVAQAAAQGANAVIVSRADDANPIAQLVVADTHQALGQIAAQNRRRSQATVIALTGSQGKTTVKEMIAAILSECAETLATDANLNNTIGVPLTLLNLESRHKYAVIEMGANAKGEIAFSASITSPDIALITNANAAHLEGFGSLQGIVAAKGEILDGLVPDGIAVLNADDPNLQAWTDRAKGRKIATFGVMNNSEQAHYFARDIVSGDRGRVEFLLCSPVGEMAIQLQLMGLHNVANAVAAAAVAIEAGASLHQVAAGLAKLTPVYGRLNPLAGVKGCQLIDDTYNASPSSFKAAIDVLMTFSQRKILVAGEMKELGEASTQSHAEVGRYAKAVGVEALWAVGGDCRDMVEAYGEGGWLFSNQEALAEYCRQQVNDDTVLLIKGSRGAKMEIIIDGLKSSGGE